MRRKLFCGAELLLCAVPVLSRTASFIPHGVRSISR